MSFSPHSPSSYMAWMQTHVWAAASGDLGAVGREISALCCPLPRTILQCRWHSCVLPDLADPCTSSLPTAIPVRREPFLERSPSPRAAEVSGPLSSSQHGAEQTFAGKLRWLHSPCLAVPTQCLAWPQSTPALKAAGDCQSSLSGRCSPGNGWVHLWDGSRGFTAGQA